MGASWQNFEHAQPLYANNRFWSNGGHGVLWGAYSNGVTFDDSLFLDNGLASLGVKAIPQGAEPRVESATIDDLTILAYVFIQEHPAIFRNVTFTGERPVGVSQLHQACEGGDENDPNAGPKKGDTVAVGPIAGVHSKSRKKSILIFNGRERYDEWHFTTDLVNQTRVEGPQGGFAVPLAPTVSAEGGMQIKSLRWIGRPFPPFLDQTQNGAPQDGTMPDGSKPGFNVPRPDPKSPKG
jgi:hypothetical protein